MSSNAQSLIVPTAMQPLSSVVCVEAPSSTLPSQVQGSLRKSRYVPRSFVQHNYHDRSNEMPDCAPSVTRGGISKLFPEKLHAAIEMMAAEGFGHICSWQPHGRAFLVHDMKEFDKVLPRYFGKMKMSSFQRQLNLYGFSRLTHGPDKGAYYHELFLKGRHFLSRKIQRCRVKGNGARSATNPDAEPNFYAMPPVSPLPQSSLSVVPMSLPPKIPSCPARELLRQVSLTSGDLVIARGPETKPTAKQELDELDAAFWNNMEALLENVDEPNNSVPQHPEVPNLVDPNHNDLSEIDDIFEPLPLPQTAPEPSMALSSDAIVVDDELTELMKEIFQKDEFAWSNPPNASKVKVIASTGGANAVAYTRSGTFSRRRSACNRAA